MKQIKISYLILVSFFFATIIYANENNQGKENVNCIDENLNPCLSLNTYKDKSDKKIVVNNLSKDKKKKVSKNKTVKKANKNRVIKNEINIKSKSIMKKVKKSSSMNKNKKKRKLIKKKEKKNKKKKDSLLTSSNKSNKNFNFNKEMSFNEYKELVIKYSTSTQYPNIDN